MPSPTPIPEADAFIVDTHGFGMEQYCGVFVLPHDEGAALVETGPSPTADNVSRALEALALAPEDVTHILPTHIHLDHAGATWSLLETCSQATAYIHHVGAPFLIEPDKVDKLLVSVERAVGQARFPDYGTVQPLPSKRVVEVKPGQRVELPGRLLELIDAPGHAPHQYAVHDLDHRVAYVGDAAGICTPDGPVLMTTPPPAFDLSGWRRTLDALDGLDLRWLALTHFGWVDAAWHLPRFREALEAWVDEISGHFQEGLSLDEAVARLLATHDEGLAVYDEATWEEEVRMNATGVWLWLGQKRA